MSKEVPLIVNTVTSMINISDNISKILYGAKISVEMSTYISHVHIEIKCTSVGKRHFRDLNHHVS